MDDDAGAQARGTTTSGSESMSTSERTEMSAAATVRRELQKDVQSLADLAETLLRCSVRTLKYVIFASDQPSAWHGALGASLPREFEPDISAVVIDFDVKWC